MKKGLVILAGGEGSRFSKDKIKALAQVGPNGETLMHYNIYDAVMAGCDKVVVVLNPKHAEDIQKVLEESLGDFLAEHGVSFYFVREGKERIFPGKEPSLVGPGRALLDCSQYLCDSRFVVINADDFYGREPIRAIFEYLCSLEEGSQQKYCLMAYPLCKTLNCAGEVNRAFCTVDEAGDICDMVETRKIKTCRNQEGVIESILRGDNVLCEFQQPVSVNLFGFTPDLFDLLKEEYNKYLKKAESGQTKAEFLLSTILGKLSRENYVKTHMLRTEHEFMGITYEEDVMWVSERIGSYIACGIYPQVIGKKF